jgi:hypothetical protein
MPLGGLEGNIPRKCRKCRRYRGGGLPPLFFNEDSLRKTTVSVPVTQGLLCFSVPVLVPVFLNEWPLDRVRASIMHD